MEGKKQDGEEVTSPMKEVQPEEQHSVAAKTVLFAKEVNVKEQEGE